MKNLLLILLLALAGLFGCAHSYVITMNNGMRISSPTKPRLQGSKYVFKDARGKEISVPVGRVREIAPASMVKEEKPAFNSQPQSR